jgi:hypothetical protein
MTTEIKRKFCFPHKIFLAQLRFAFDISLQMPNMNQTILVANASRVRRFDHMAMLRGRQLE